MRAWVIDRLLVSLQLYIILISLVKARLEKLKIRFGRGAG